MKCCRLHQVLRLALPFLFRTFPVDTVCKLLRKTLHAVTFLLAKITVSCSMSPVHKPYSRDGAPYKMKYWRGIYFGRLADFLATANVKSAINLASGIR